MLMVADEQSVHNIITAQNLFFSSLLLYVEMATRPAQGNKFGIGGWIGTGLLVSIGIFSAIVFLWKRSRMTGRTTLETISDMPMAGRSPSSVTEWEDSFNNLSAILQRSERGFSVDYAIREYDMPFDASDQRQRYVEIVSYV